MSSYEILNVKNIYDEIAHEFNKTRGYYWKPITDFIDNLENNSLIYDIGCGNGRNMTYELDAGRHGGDGVAFDISGEYKYYGGGGGGGAHQPGYSSPAQSATGGKGGGGNGASFDRNFGPSGRGESGQTNTGGGGGGGFYTGGGTSQGGSGGPGIIIVRY